jgi:photosystem II stability/assembly factor-like uncharacterized protein
MHSYRVRNLALVLLTLCGISAAQQFDPKLYQEMQWRCIGPFRGGRTVAIAGIPTQPNVFFMAPNNGGVWKSTDYGRTWNPIFDSQPTGSVGALAIAPSDPNVIYVGSGESLRRPDLSTGDGIYKSTDGGLSWQHLGLRDGQQIGSIIVDPHDPNRLFVGVMGHPYGPNSARGVFRSLDGGITFEKVLYKDEDTGAMQLVFDPVNPQIIYADMFASRRPPWTTGDSYSGPGSGLYKSTDGGSTWTQLTKGLPDWSHHLGRIGFAVAPSDGRRLYALADSPDLGGLYRSEDAGETWTQINTDDRLWGRGDDFAAVTVDPQNADKLYIANVSTYLSTDKGAHFTAIKGAPGGDDYHTVWINPTNPQVIALAVDQGATISVNGGDTWSSWYNQPTAQFYHVITDNQFPYWVYGGQQESGSIGTASRSDYGEITFRDWLSVGVEEYGYVAPDPLNPNLIYGGKTTRFNRITGQTQDVSPVVIRTGKYRFNRTAPLIFSPVDPNTLYLGSNVLFKTTNGGNRWDIISPDLTREDPGVPPSLGVFVESDPAKGKHRGVIYSLAPSPKDGKLIWAGTDDGLVWITHDAGKTWSNVTPPELTPWSKVAQLDASHFDADTVYAAVNRFRLDDLQPYIYRTHDGGKTWKKIVAGLPNDPVNTVREDAVRKGLLFAGTERTVYVSFDDGDHWQSLRLNLPASSIRDLVVHNDDIVVGTHGRSFWILDDITALRQLDDKSANAAAHLFAPQITYRIRNNNNTDTPLPPEEPAGKNPPDGAILDYTLKSAATGPVVIEISDAAGKIVRKFSSADQAEAVNPKELNIPTYWIRPFTKPSPEPGMHRFVWDLRYPAPKSLAQEYPISAIEHDTPRDPLGPAVLPGKYAVKLTANGETMTQPLVIKMDPRVKTGVEGLRDQFLLETKIADAMNRSYEAVQQVRAAREKLKKAPVTSSSKTGQEKLNKIESGGDGETPGALGGKGLAQINESLYAILEIVDSADSAPTSQVVATFHELDAVLAKRLEEWKQMRSDAFAAK